MDLATPKQILYYKLLNNELKLQNESQIDKLQIDELQNESQIDKLRIDELRIDELKIDELQNVDLNKITKKQITKLINSFKIKLNKFENLPKINFSYYKYIFTDFKENEYTINNKYTPYIYVKGTQLNTKNNTLLSVMCFFKLLILDYDLSEEYVSKEELLNYITILLEKENETFLVYETHNGYHVYCVSNTFSHYDKNTINFMRKLKCDPFYISFSSKIGFVVRLEKKKDRYEEFIEKFVKQINYFPIKSDLIDLIKIKDNYIKII